MTVNFGEQVKIYANIATIIGVAVSIFALAAMVFFEAVKLDRSQQTEATVPTYFVPEEPPTLEARVLAGVQREVVTASQSKIFKLK